MPYTLTVLVQLGPSLPGVTLACDLRDTLGGFVEPDIVNGFIELGNGDYLWTGLIPDGFQGAAVFNDNSDGTYMAAMAINPQEHENPDVKTSSILAKLSGSSVSVISPMLEAGRIDLIRGDDYTLINGRQLQFTPEDPDAWPPMIDGSPIVLGVGNDAGTEFESDGSVSGGVATVEVKGTDTLDVGRGHYRFTLRTNGETTETLAEGVLNLHGGWGGYE